jgi:membrane-bound ClpP family serine protease
MLLDEIKQIKSTKKELSKFGYTIGIALLILGLVLYYYEKPSFPYIAGSGILFSLAGLISPILLKPVHKIWMGLAVILGFIMTRVILSLLFYFVFTPMRFFARVFRKNFIDLRIEKKTDTFWNKRESEEYKPIDTERQF